MWAVFVFTTSSRARPARPFEADASLARGADLIPGAENAGGGMAEGRDREAPERSRD